MSRELCGLVCFLPFSELTYLIHSCYENLTDAGLGGVELSSAGPDGEIQSTAPSKELLSSLS